MAVKVLTICAISCWYVLLYMQYNGVQHLAVLLNTCRASKRLERTQLKQQPKEKTIGIRNRLRA